MVVDTKMSASEYLDELKTVSSQLDKTYKDLSSHKNVSSEDKEKYLSTTAQLTEIGSLVEALITISNKREKLHLIEEVLELVFATFNKIISNMNIVIENAEIGKKITGELTGEEALLKKMIDSLQATGDIDPSLLETIDSVRNSSLERYAVSILGDEAKNSKKYPWLYYVPSPDDAMLDALRKIDEPITSGSPEAKFSYNFQILIKQVYLITKLNVRNLNMIRMADIKTTSAQLKNYKSILEKLLFFTVDNIFVPGEYSELYSNYGSHTTDFRKLLGADLYKRFVFHVIEDGKGFENTKIVKTETLLKYLLIAVNKITSVQVSIYKNFYNAVIDVINKIIIANRNITQLDIVVSKTTSGVDKDDLRMMHNFKNNLFTFVKIRSDNPDKINERFRVSLDRDRQIMYLGYDPTPESIYKDTNSFELKDKFKKLKNPEEPYPHNYLFGPFTYIFKTHQGNKEISNHDSMKPLIDKLINGQSVCIIGYGASGSGKTTTLVYASFEKEKERRDGILVNFCNQLGKKGTYDNIEISLVELEGNINEGDEYRASANYKILPVPENEKQNPKYTDEDVDRSRYYTPHTFSYEKNGWMYEESNNKTPGIDKLKEYNSSTEMGDFIVQVMDGKRSVKATTNNPVSSRSHMIIFIRLRKTKSSKDKKNIEFEDNQPYLIICDFAGVENKFDCSNPDVIRAFEIIKSTTSDKPFYKDIIDTSVKQFTDIENMALPSITDVQDNVNTKEIEALLKKYGTDKLIKGLDELIIQVKSISSPTQYEIGKDKFISYRDNLARNFGSVTAAYELLKIWGIRASDVTTGNMASISKKGKNSIIKNIKEVIDYIKSLARLEDVKNQKKTAGSNRLKAKDDTIRRICSNRVKEGQFINDSLENLRIFISYFITKIQGKDTSVMNPKFIDACIPIQCNPNYEDCFGFSASDIDEQESNQKSVIATQIRKRLCCGDKKDECSITDNCDIFSNMTFCIFNVINLSQKANNPPPIPYIDISGLVNEQTRLESLGKMMVSNDFKINDDRTITLVYKPYLEELKNSPLIDPNASEGTIKGQTRDDLIKLIDVLLSQHNNPADIKPDITLSDLRRLITYVNKINSLSTIGTMEFTDMIAKFGLNRNVCNYKYVDDQTKSGRLTTGSQINGISMTLEEYKKYINQLYQELYNESIIADN